ncbi:uncharacterized protein LOC119166686 isoform X1 [Rhipicephalus microplus]|uniref:uncharacterized protein LOC119166686 isoform X1 n=2 Tax=Rhipicephalus microplus TaxID=6941 RepID=UPI001886BD05|nr:uncharacterized protein LOC119166686 [Rhipicephalus microplus]
MRATFTVLTVVVSMLLTAAKDDGDEAIQKEGSNAMSSTAKPETITYRMTVLDSLHNDTELYNTTSGSVIIVGRNARQRSKFLERDPTFTNAESRTSSFRKSKILDIHGDPATSGRNGRFSDPEPESRIVNDPESYFPIKGFIPIIGVPEMKPDSFQRGSQQLVRNEFSSAGPKRSGPIPPGDTIPPSAYTVLKPPKSSNGLPPIVRPDWVKKEQNAGAVNFRPIKHMDEGRGPFGNAVGPTYVAGPDVGYPVSECVCVPFYLCKEGSLVSPRLDHQSKPGAPVGLLIPIDERSNDRDDAHNSSAIESRVRRDAANQSEVASVPAYATEIMQRMLSGPSFSQCGVLRTCCNVMAPPVNRGGPMFQPESPLQTNIMAQLFPKKATFASQHRMPAPNLPLPFRKPVRRPPVPIDASLPFPAPSVGMLGPMLPPQQPEASIAMCGARNAFGIHGRVKNLHYPESGADFAEFPWHVGIMKKLAPQESLYVCGGTLIASQWVATAAHCLKNLRPQDIKIRLGEWDVNREDEFYAHVEKQVAQVVVHPEFFPGNLNNDLALIRLDSPVDLNLPHIGAACLPGLRETFEGHRCWVTGWGKDAFGQQGEYQHILKKVDVPVVSHDDCQQRLRRTRLGPYYQLHPGFVCAGGEPGKDACTGDGGSPLVCEYNGLWKAVGLVSWGIGCGQAGVPGVYVNLAQYRDWIDSVITGLQ